MAIRANSAVKLIIINDLQILNMPRVKMMEIDLV